MKRIFRRHGRSIVYLIATDWFILVASFILAMHWRRYDPALNLLSPYHIAAEILVVMAYATLLISVFGVLDFYKRRTTLNRTNHLLRIIQTVTITITCYFLLRTLIKSPVFVPSRIVIGLWGILLLAALAVHRLLVFPWLVALFSRTRMQRNVVIIGVSQQSIRLAEALYSRSSRSTLKLIGFISDHTKKEEKITCGLTCIGTPAELSELVEPYGIEGAIITHNNLPLADLIVLIEECIRLFGWVDVHTDQSAVWHTNLSADTYFDIPFVRMRAIPSGPALLAYKQITDKLGALIGILLTSPVLIATAIAIKLTSPGPIFYARERIGKDGNPFLFYKFRSMSVGADQDKQRNAEIEEYLKSGDKVSRKTINTACVTPVGKFIRKWAIDELPQLFNVLKGDMSLIGPRPVPPNEYNLNDDWHKKRFDIKPGCGGLWKIYAARDGISINDTVLYDLYYARNMNPLMDLYIVIMTIWVIFSGRADG